MTSYLCNIKFEFSRIIVTAYFCNIKLERGKEGECDFLFRKKEGWEVYAWAKKGGRV